MLLHPIHMAAVVAALFTLAIAPATGFAADTPAPDHHAHGAAHAGAACLTFTATTGAMRHMQAIHEQMAAAKTPADRQVLMAEHMKAMQEGMTMMQQMDSSSCPTAMSTRMMQMRMDMMTMMMQMMMDRQQMQMMGGMTPGAPATPSTPATPGK